MSRLWVVTYDIEDNRCRRRVHRILKDYGQRVQYSVFECWLTKNQLEVLHNLICAEIQPIDSVRWYPLCKWCQADVSFQGLGAIPEDTDYFIS